MVLKTQNFAITAWIRVQRANQNHTPEQKEIICVPAYLAAVLMLPFLIPSYLPTQKKTTTCLSRICKLIGVVVCWF